MEHVAIILFFFTMTASFVQRVSGFGFGIVVMTLLPALMPTYGEATALSGSLAIVAAAITAIKMRRHLNWSMLWPILLAFTFVSLGAIHVVALLYSDTLKRILGAVLVLTSLYFFFLDGKFRIRPSRTMGLSMGVLSGLMGGLFAMQGPPAVVYFISSTKTKEEYTALTQWYFFLGNSLMTLFRWREGFVTANVGKLWLVGCAGVLLGLFLGSKLYQYISVRWLRRAVYLVLLVSGVIACFS
ncbi:MAG: sulfite exporter TauE/SafE family protein [Paludibacteraceae bacterium]|nr:sulfite exporter TauE/SafE family protein [Paludibacteraceae bacterium]